MSSGGDMSQFAYGMAFGIGILVIVLLVTVSCCCCLRDHSREFIPARMALQHLDALSGTAADRGIDEATLQSYPTVLFSSVKHLEKNNLADSSDVIGGGSCSICLGEYKEGDLLRLLPVCGHLFHMKCVDPWLRLHATCPVCRRSSVGQLGQPGLESQTVAVLVDGDLHSGDSMVERYDRGLQIPFPQFKSGVRKVVLRKRIRWKNASVTFTERKH